MNKLVKIYFIEQFKLNKICHNPNRKEAIKAILMSMVFILLLGLISFYSFLMFFGLKQMNLAFLIPGFSLISVFALVFILNFFFLMPGFCFNNKEDNMILALPFKMSQIVSARISFIYIISLLLSWLTVIPAFIILLLDSGFNIQSMGYFVLSFFFPLLPLAIAGLIQSLIAKVAGRFKYKNIITIALTLAFLIVYFAFMMNVNQIDEQELLLYIQNMATSIGHKFFLASWLTEALNGDIWGITKFLLVSVGSLIIYIYITSKFYYQLSSDQYVIGKSNKQVKYHTGSIFSALFKKDLKRYFSSSIYVVNTIVGSLLYLVFAISTHFIDLTEIVESMGLMLENNQIIQILPFIGMIFMGLSVTTSASLSIEGKNVWIIKTLPISTWQIYSAKLMVQLVQTLPVCLISAILLMLGLSLPFTSFIWILLLPILMSIFMGLLGLKMNQLFVNYNWKSEAEVVKRGLAMTITLLLGGIVPIALIFFCLLNPSISSLIFYLSCGFVLFVGTLILIPITMNHCF